MSEDFPTLDELAAGAFLHDVGKLFQRARGESDLPERVRNLESEVLPRNDESPRYTHRHALFTAGFFDWIESAGLGFPMRREPVRKAAAYHHKPLSGAPWTWLVTQADRLSAGMDRSERERAHEIGDKVSGRGAFRRVPLRSLFDTVSIGIGATPAESGGEHAHLPGELQPDKGVMMPKPSAELDSLMLDAYARTADGFEAGFKALCANHAHDGQAELFHEGLLSLGERFWWAVPSSTIDEPDISLFDHSLSVSAFASCLFRFHEEHGTLDEDAAIRDGAVARFRLVKGDLSGIQNALFRLASQQVKGVNRILRARSFMMGQIVEAAALAVRKALGLPPYVVLQRAGGQFVMLVPAIDNLDAVIDQLRREINEWLVDRYFGDLVLAMAMTPPLADADFKPERMAGTFDRLRTAVEEEKQRPLHARLLRDPVLRVDYPIEADGNCAACGVRPASEPDQSDPAIRRCAACAAEARIGRDLPRAQAIGLLEGGDEGSALFGRWSLKIATERDPLRPGRAVAGAFRLEGGEAHWPTTRRFMANHVPVFVEDEWDDLRYEDIPQDPADIDRLEAGALKTMAHLAHASRDPHSRAGRPMLGVLKADVDRLGQIFAFGLKGRDGKRDTIGRRVTLSRLMDGFFTGYLDRLLERDFPDVYTVYAGGDDLLLIGPWTVMPELALRLREDFREFTVGNGNLSLSAGIELVDLREPLNRSADRAEARLEHTKTSGRDRVSFIGAEPLSWSDFDRVLTRAQDLAKRTATDEVSAGFLYKLMHFADEKRKADGGDTGAAIWHARYSYHLARTLPKHGYDEEAPFWHALMGLDGDAVPTRTILSMVIYQSR